MYLVVLQVSPNYINDESNFDFTLRTLHNFSFHNNQCNPPFKHRPLLNEEVNPPICEDEDASGAVVNQTGGLHVIQKPLPSPPLHQSSGSVVT